MNSVDRELKYCLSRLTASSVVLFFFVDWISKPASTSHMLEDNYDNNTANARMNA